MTRHGSSLLWVETTGWFVFNAVSQWYSSAVYCVFETELDDTGLFVFEAVLI